MIKIEIIRDSAIVADEYLDLINNENNGYVSPKRNLQNWIQVGTFSTQERHLVGTILARFDEIVTSTPDRLRKIIDELGQFQGQFGTELIRRFRYENFRRSRKAIWLVRQLKLKSCPYCNAQYIISLSKNGKLLCHFDHFYPKSFYPYLCLSFYNLIPCCSYCNLQKSNTNPIGRTRLHPFENSLAENFHFQATTEAIANFSLNGRTEPTGTNIKVIPAREADISFHESIFKLEELHNEHHDVIDEIYLKSVIYNSSYYEELKDLYVVKNGILTEEELDRIIYGTYLESSKINARPLAKMTQDLLGQFMHLRKRRLIYYDPQ